MISFEKIKQRKKKMESPTTSGYRPNIKNITSPITMNVMETFLSSINNTEDVNYFGTDIFGIYETFVHDNSNRPEYIKKISGIINENIIPQYKDLKSLKNYLNQSDVFNVFEESVEDFIYCDRVIKNDRSINKRFNMRHFIESNSDLDTEEMVRSLCEFIDTYDISMEAKYHIALENITFMLKSKDKTLDESVIQNDITDYFLMRESVMTDTYIRKLQKVAINSPLVNESTLNPYLFSKGHYYGDRIQNILEYDLSTLNSEKKVSEQIYTWLDEMSIIESKANQKKLDCILALPLAINVSESFINSQLVNYISIHENGMFTDYIKESLDQYKDGLRGINFLNENKNDKGEEVPKKCPKCEGDIGVFFQGEPVYLCKKCKKYFGTVPFPSSKKSVKESTIFNSKDIYYNKDKFDSGEITLCFVTGLSGSGKSTMSHNLESKNVEVYELDDVLFNWNFSDNNLKEYGDLISSFFKGPGKKFRYRSVEEFKKADLRRKGFDYDKNITINFVKYAITYCSSHKNKKYIVEGCELLWSLEPSYLKDYAVFIKGTSTLISLIRSSKRDSKNGLEFLDLLFDIERLKIYRMDSKNVNKWYNYYKKIDIDESYNYMNLLETKLEQTDLDKAIKQFKVEQRKDSTAFQKVLNALYAKTPNEIIEDIPHVLGIVRVAFIFTPIAVPVVGPVLSLLNVCIDKILSFHVNVKQSEKLFKYLRNEKSKMEEKLEDIDDEEKKKKTESYIKELEKCMKSVKDYAYDQLPKEIEDTDDDSNEDIDDLFGDFDFDFEIESYNIPKEANKNIEVFTESVYENDDISLLADLSLYEQTLENIFENKNRVNSMIFRHIESITENLQYIAPIIANCPNVINYREFSEAVRDCAYDPTSMDNVNVDNILNKALENKFDSDAFRNTVMESESIKVLDQVVTEGFNLNNVKLAFQSMKKKMKDLSTKQRSICQAIDVTGHQLLNSIQKAAREDRREAIIKGSIIPSFSKCIKLALTFGGITAVNPMIGLISAVGYFGSSKILTQKEKQLVYDEIATELQVVEKQLQIAENDGDMNQYRFLLNYQKKLIRERQRIRYGLKVAGRRIPDATAPKHD